MNFIELSPELFSEKLAEAEAQKDKIAAIIFDKERIIKFNDEYEAFDDEILGYILDAVDEIVSDDEYVSRSVSMYHFMKNGFSVSSLKPPTDGSLKSEFALMPPLIACAAAFCEDARSRGVEWDVLTATFQMVNTYMHNNFYRVGRYGTSGYHAWLPVYATGEILRVDAFQFEIRELDGKHVLSVHIPSGTKLDVQENVKNFARAIELFNKCYSEYEFKGLMCKSWLLNPHIAAIMGRETNISRFGDMFERFEIDAEDGVYSCVFGASKSDAVDGLKEETSLQKNIKNYLRAGNRFKDYGGFISLDRLSELQNQAK